MTRFLTSIVMLAAAAVAHAQTQPMAGVEYKVISPAQPAVGPKVEVVEFFNYACPHCYDFEPLLKSWIARKPGDVEFRYVPAVFNDRMIPLAKLYYTLEELQLRAKLHDKVYEAIHDKGLRLDDPAILFKWIADHGVEAKKFQSVYESFSVANQVQRAAQLTRSLKVPGTPYLVVNGKYLTGPSMVVGADGNVDTRRFVAVLNQLIDKERRKS
ncbi:MAG TPA: thiol:disulfide interchange protein DsbA/DsbL [Burkholderiales bacterium]|nr:thiol:disulfide interchange protein DsbA/DsbL [Burkholderiales bacterium]